MGVRITAVRDKKTRQFRFFISGKIGDLLGLRDKETFDMEIEPGVRSIILKRVK